MTDSIMKQDNQSLSLRDRLKLTKNIPCLLLDVSGSMNIDCEPGHRKIDALRDIVLGLNTNPAVYVFNHACVKASKSSIPEPSGSTTYSIALNYVKNFGHKKVVMITDGECDHYDQVNALDAVLDMELNIMYVGSGPKPEFLDKLANAASGKCSLDDLSMTKELTERLTLLLESPKVKDIEL